MVVETSRCPHAVIATKDNVSRLRYFGRSLLAGYGTLGATVLYTLLSVPLALHYLPREEYGLWGLIIQIVVLMQLAEAGMTGACARILIDYKDDRESLAGMVKTVTVVLLIQGIGILLASLVMAPMLGRLLDVPPHLQPVFIVMLRLYALAFAVGYSSRIFQLLLFAFQRNDLVNHGLTISFGIQLVVLWIVFRAGGGLWAFMIAQAVSVLFQALFCHGACLRLRVFRYHDWKAPFRGDRFWEIFHYAKDRALVIMGMQVLLAAPALLIGRFLGLEAVATWTVGTRLFVLCRDALYRIHDTAYPALAEMLVRGEEERFGTRFRDLTVLTLTLGGGAAALLMGVNTSFVSWWTTAQIQWSWRLDVGLGLWLLVLLSVRSHWVAISITKEIRMMRYLYFAEALVVIAAGSAALLWWQDMVWLLTTLLTAALLLSFPYTAYRASRIVRRSFLEVAVGWFRAAFVVLIPAVAAGSMVRGWAHSLPLVVEIGVVSVVIALTALLLVGCQPSVRALIREMAARRLRNQTHRRVDR
jgi:O-antigen/teichoic acid export membrane protein